MPPGLAQTHVGPYVARRTERAKLIGPTGIVGQGEIGGVLGPVGDAN